MLTPKQIKIFEVFLIKPYKEMTYKEIKEYAKENSNSIIQKAISKFLLENLVKKREVGNNLLYKLNLNNSTTLAYFEILVNEKLPKSAKQCLVNIQEELSEIIFLSIVVFGSYAEDKQTEKSDLDIAIFVNSAEDKRKAELAMKSVQLKCVLNLDWHIFTKEEMLEMLKLKNENLGKQLAKKHLAVYNPNIFYSIVQEGINNGFNIVYQ